jgi:hypothetical protein
MIEFRCAGWSSGPVVEAIGFVARFRGIRAVPPAASLALRTRSIHTFGLRRPLGVVALAADRCVLAAAWTPPRRVVRVPEAVEYLELREGRELPPVGARLEAERMAPRPIVSR